MMERVDVLVVGGGPAGLAAAAGVAGAGSVLVVHKDAQIGRPVRTSGGSWRRDLDRLAIPEKLYQPMETLTIAGPSVRADYRLPGELVVLDVTGTYCYLADLATAAGARIECGTRFLHAAEANGEGFACTVERGGERREIAARYVVDASGYARAVLRCLGRSAPVRRAGVGAEWEMENAGDTSRAVLFVGGEHAPAGYGWVFPTNRGTVRVGVGVIRPDARQIPEACLREFVASRAAERLGVRGGKMLERHAGVIPSEGPAERLVYGRCVAVGDCVGQALPLVGEGIRFCIDAGRRAGAALGSALENEGRAAHFLGEYERWWLKRLRRRLVLGQRANERITRYDDPTLDRKIGHISSLDGEFVAACLRIEVTAGLALRFFARRPAVAASYGASRAMRWLRK